jgi:ABC-type transport system involved in cytochrome c biogenesis permease subunit
LNNGSPFMLAALALYAVSAALYHVRSLVTRTRSIAVPHAVAGVGLLAQTTGIIQRTAALGHAPYLELSEALATIAWALVLLTLVAESRKRTTAFGVLSMPMAVVILFLAGILPDVDNRHTLAPLLNDRGWMAHIGSITAAFGALALAFCAAVAYLVQERRLKEKTLGPADKAGLSLADIEQVANWLTAFGFSMLTLGLLMGALWASTGVWHGRWYTEPIVLATVAMWIVYAAYLFQRSVRGERGRSNMRLLIAGFVLAFSTVLLVRLLFPGQHRF